ncbi:MAG: exodeoxyribonuclease VII large subunit, partial [Selenomonadaceae bacterium]|nr:exodeoxyribonuclease VII large subunit [Selenomonadaceae bacterium]
FNKKYPVDVLIVGRGGGSIEDLWAFNEETVVRAIYESKIPVISAVGHEVDVTLSDFVADKRAATPSQAAEIAVCDAAEVCLYIENLMTRLKNSAMNSIKQKEAKLQRLKNSAVFTRPKEMLLSREQRLDAALERLNRVAKAKLEEKERKCALQLEKLDMLNPARVLMRGYSMTELKGKTVRRAKDLAMGDNIRLIFVDGEAGAKILKIGS